MTMTTKTHRKNIAFAAAAFGVLFLALQEMALTEMETVFQAVAAYGLIFFMGAGRFILMMEGVSLREVSPDKAEISFQLSLLIGGLFMVYVGGLWYIGAANWREVFLFSLANIVLLSVEWVFSQRAGLDTLPEVSRLTGEVSELTQANQALTEMSQLKDSKIQTLTQNLKAETQRVSDLTQAAKADTQMRLAVNSWTLKPIPAGNMLVAICPDCYTPHPRSNRSAAGVCKCGTQLK